MDADDLYQDQPRLRFAVDLAPGRQPNAAQSSRFLARIRQLYFQFTSLRMPFVAQSSGHHSGFFQYPF